MDVRRIALHGESQQYGNLDETAAIARLPRNCLVLWLGEHQTPGGLLKCTGPEDFDKKLLKRPCGIEKLGEGPTKYFLSSGSKVPYRYRCTLPLPILSSSSIDETRPTPP